MKKIVIAGIVVLVLVAIGYFLLAPSAATAAILYVETGQVDVDTGKGWQAGTDEMELAEGNKVRTGDGEATVVLLEGEVLHLEPNSEVTLSEIGKTIKITQTTGETWNKITKISGIEEYTIETPTTVATVRGTEFMLNEEELAVDDGEVDYGHKGEPGKIKVRGKKRALANVMKEEDMPPEMLEKMKRFPEKYERALKRVRMHEIRKHKGIIMKAAEKKGYTEEQMLQELNEIDEGRKNEEEFYQKVPAMMKPKAKRTYLLTKEIKKAKARQMQ